MHFDKLNKAVRFIVFVTAFREVVADVPMFRVLAPEFLCPTDEGAAIAKPHNTIITVKTEAAEVMLRWEVRWVPLGRPSQRLTLLLWRTVRALETKLNAPQPEPLVYVIDNAELLEGVEYIFNVTASVPGSDDSTTRSFSIDNMKGDPTLLIEGRAGKLSVFLIAGDTLYVDMEYGVEAVVTTCSPTQDYYFVWSVQSSAASPLNTSETSGSRLELHPHSLQAGVTYYVSSAVYRNNGDFVTQTGLPLHVLHRGLAVSLSLDVLVVSANNSFEIRALVENHDHYGEELKFVWSCDFEKGTCGNFDSINKEILSISRGFPLLGQYEITLMVSVQDQQASSNATIIVIEPSLPVIEIKPQRRWLNENSMVTLVANASNVVPSCNLTWYFATEEYLASLKHDASEDRQHGEELPGTMTITSLEENFLNELADFTNETEWRQMEARASSASGRARLVARCGCSLTFSCHAQGTVHADVHFVLNESPKLTEIKVSPEAGTAMETVFRLSTAASDTDKPLRYSFHCSLDTGAPANGTLLLASYLDHSAVETLLPFVDATGTKIWVEVCDSLGACSSTNTWSVLLEAGEGRAAALVDALAGHAGRCEVAQLRTLVQCAVSTYMNAKQEEVLSKFTEALFDVLPTIDTICIMNNRDYPKLLDWLIQAGIDTPS